MKQLIEVILTASLIFHSFSYAGSKNKPHSHQGELDPYDGKHLSYNITIDQLKKLANGDMVAYNEKNGKGGRGVVIQDIHATPAICMNRIKDLENYHKMVPKVNKVVIYEDDTLLNSTRKMKAEFNVGLSLLTFRYYLSLTHEPVYNTLTWTLDYRYNSDFDDTIGHWQVMPHPEKKGWSRVLYSTQVKLFPWVPEFVVTFLTKTALIEATTWVKEESEKLALSGTFHNEILAADTLQPDLAPCFVTNEYGARYDTHCIISAACSTIKSNVRPTISDSSNIDNNDLDSSNVHLAAPSVIEVITGGGGSGDGVRKFSKIEVKQSTDFESEFWEAVDML